jgi:hypothetical protein
MAGQPQEPSWTPAGQEQTQARPAWPQQPTFTPPAPGQQDAYGYPQQSAQGGYPPPPPPPSPQPGYAGQEQGQAYGQEQAKAYGQEQSYVGPDQTYAGQDQTYAGQDQPYAGQDQTYAGQGQHYQPQGQPGPEPTRWQAAPGMPGARPGPGKQKARGERGFFGSLFDFSFTSMVTPKIIKVLYALFTAWTALVALVILIISFRTGGAVAGLFVLIVIVPIVVLLMLGIYRVILEAFMVVFRIYEETVKIREHNERQSDSRILRSAAVHSRRPTVHSAFPKHARANQRRMSTAGRR